MHGVKEVEINYSFSLSHNTRTLGQQQTKGSASSFQTYLIYKTHCHQMWRWPMGVQLAMRGVAVNQENLQVSDLVPH